MTPLATIVDRQIAELSRCREHLGDGTCPLLARTTAKGTPDTKPREPRTPLNGTRPKVRHAAKPARHAAPTSPASPKPASTPAPAKVIPGRRAFGDDEVLHVIDRLKGATPQELAKALEVPYGTAWRKLSDLAERKLLTKGGDKKYRRAVAQG